MKCFLPKIFCLCLMMACGNALATEKFAVSYYSHPAMPPFIDFIESVYAELDIEIEPVVLSATRGMFALNDGMVDADIVRIRSLVEPMENVIVLKPEIYHGEVLLICRTAENCSTDILHERNSHVISTRAVQLLLKSLNIQAQMISHETIDKSLELIRAGRYESLLIGSTSSFREKLSNEFNLVVVKDVHLHHVIHKKHRALVPQLEAAIRNKLSSFDPDNFNF